MAWVWYDRLDTKFAPAVFDYKSPVGPADAMASEPIDISRGHPIFRAQSKLANFENLHCPPTGDPPAVDNLWREIILKFVPGNLVQFYPITLIARDGYTQKFFWVIPFSKVRCIDVDRSDIVSKVEFPNITMIISCNHYVHKDKCLGELHLARDEQLPNHILVSDELRNELAKTGESSMFLQPEDIPTFMRRTVN